MKKILLSLLMVAVFTCNAATYYITYTGAGLKDGSSWANAGDSSMIQSFINAASAGDNLWVAAGTYKPTAFHPLCTSCGTARQYTFALKSKVSLYGGFNGTETLVTQAAPSANPTILSGNIGSPNDSTDNIARIITGINISDSTEIKGFTISGAYSVGNTVTINGISFSDGGGVLVYNSSLKIKNCIIEHCTSKYGAGVYYKCNYQYTGGKLTVDSCVIQYNTHDGGAIAGDAVYYDGNGFLNVSGIMNLYNTIFRSNKYRTTGCLGGAVYALSPLTVDKCLFIGNDANYTTGTGGQGGAINSTDVKCYISNSVFVNNKAGTGGAIWRALDKNTVYLNNCVFYNNIAQKGGAFFADNYGKLWASYCTFYGNSASNAGSIFYTWTNSSLSGGCSISKSIIWANTSSFFYGASGSNTTSSSLVQQGISGSNTVVANPQFADSTDPDGPDNIWMTSDDGFMPTCSSPALDAATGAGFLPGDYDIVGTARPQGGGREMGAYEKIPLGNFPTVGPIVQSPTVGCVSDSTIFSIAYTNPGTNYTYQWKVNNVIVSSDTFSLKTLVANGVTVSYTLSSPDYCSGGNSITKTITSNVLTLLTPSITITKTPASHVCDTNRVIRFTATVTNQGTKPSYQWYKNNQPVGSDTAVYIPTSYNFGDSVYCILTSNRGCLTNSTATSNKINITAFPAPVITNTLSNTTSFSGLGLSFSITVGSGVYTYQWQVNSGSGFSNISNTPPYSISGNATITVLGINPTAVSMNGNIYRCIVTDTCGRSDTSNSATLTVIPIQNLITTEPATVTVCGSSTLTVSANSICSSPLYQWQQRSGSNPFSNIPNANSPTYTTYCNTLDFRCIVSCGTGNNDTSGIVKVNCHPVADITQQFTGQKICIGESATFSVTATGYNLTYRWSGYFQNQIIDGTDAYGQVISGATTANLSISNAYADTSVQSTSMAISCKVTDGCGRTDNTTLEYLTVYDNPDVTFQIPSSVCLNTSSIQLSGASPVGGVFSGNGVTGNDFYPAQAGLGQHIVTYSYTNLYGCTGIGQKTISVVNCTSIEDLSALETITLYPNPASNELNLSLGNLKAEQVSIYNVEGRLVSKINQPANNSIDIRGLEKGVYIAEVKVRDIIQRVRWVKM